MIKKSINLVIRSLLARSGILVCSARKYEVVPTGNPRALKLLQSLHSLAKETILPDLPDLSDAARAHLLNLMGLPSAQALYLLDILHKSLAAEGAICEMGVAQGCTSRLIAQEILSTKRDLWLFDSFAGLPAPTEEDTLIDDVSGLGHMDAYRGSMSCARNLVETKLKEIGFPAERMFIIEGYFDEDTPRTKRLPKQVCFAFVDFDLYKPIHDALEWLHLVLSAGAHVIIHDYGYFSSGAQKAVDEFYERNKTDIVTERLFGMPKSYTAVQGFPLT
jgi:O-methyltransferase